MATKEMKSDKTQKKKDALRNKLREKNLLRRLFKKLQRCDKEPNKGFGNRFSDGS